MLDLKTMIVFHKAERTIRATESQIFKKHDLTPTQFSVLETLYSKGELRIQDLIDRILATSGNMTVVIKNMERDGWIVRTCDPNDRRAFLIGLTEQGRQKIEAALPEHIKNVQNALSILPPEDKEELIRILKNFKKLS
ncbi:Transcriptional regulator, MarR family [Streptococcus sp. DD11]|nr:Transcriptional regulator, MarR family [Streptococcus sp. DD11]